MTDVVLSIRDERMHLTTDTGSCDWPLGDTLVEIVAEPEGPRAMEFTAALAFGAGRERRTRIGVELYQGMFGAAPQEWSELQRGASEKEPLRVRIDIQCAALAPLPWELMRGTPAGQRLWLNGRVLPRRGRLLEAQDQPRQGSRKGPLRILLVVCNPEDPELLADCELAMIGAALADLPGRVHTEVIDGPSLQQLAAEITHVRPHVLHFIGHGMRAVAGDAGGLYFNARQPVPPGDGTAVPTRARPAREAWTLEPDQAHHLYHGWQPRLVVLNACRQAHAPAAEFGGLVDTFLNRGTSAVVAMQADIESPAAAQFSHALYTGLGRAQSIDAAVTSVRNHLDMADGDGPSWALPVLECGVSDPGEVVALEFGRNEPELSRLSQQWPFEELAMFLGRPHERRIGWWEQCEETSTPARLLAVTSAHSESGKTWVAKWCLLTCMLRGEDVTYVDLADPRIRGNRDDPVAMDWLAVVRAMREACTDPRQPDPMRREDFARFNQALNRAAQGGPAWAQRMPTSPQDRGHRFVVESDRHAEMRKEEIIKAFLGVLRTRALNRRRSHLLALDHAESITESDFRNVLLPLLLTAVQEADGEFPLRLLIVAPQSWPGYRHLAEALPGDPLVLTKNFPFDDRKRLAREFWERKAHQQQVPSHLSYADFERLVHSLPENAQHFPVTVYQKALDLLLLLGSNEMNEAG